jgi:adenylate kinase family enzyme
MKKVVVIGSGGSGKSTFSQRLGEVTGLPAIHLDRLYWKPNWVEPAKGDWEEIIKREIAKDEWILDGNFGGTRQLRMNAADTIIILDLPRVLCLYRIIKRWAANRGRTRPDMAVGCNEKIDLEFISWVWNYRNTSRVRALAELSSLHDKRIVVLRTRKAVEQFLDDPYAH